MDILTDYIKNNNITDFISDEERTLFSQKLYESEQYNKEHPE